MLGRAAQAYKSLLKEEAMGGGDLYGVVGGEEAEAVLFLANYEHGKGNLDEAAKLCGRLLDFGGPEKDQARGLLREIRAAVDI